MNDPCPFPIKQCDNCSFKSPKEGCIPERANINKAAQYESAYILRPKESHLMILVDDVTKGIVEE